MRKLLGALTLATFLCVSGATYAQDTEKKDDAKADTTKKKERTTTSPADGLFFVLSFRAAAARERAGCPNCLSARLVCLTRAAARLLAAERESMLSGSGRKKAGRRTEMIW